MSKYLRSNSVPYVSESIKNAIKTSNFNAKTLIRCEETKFNKFTPDKQSLNDKYHTLSVILDDKIMNNWNNHDIVKYKVEKFNDFKKKYVEEQKINKNEIIQVNMIGEGFTKYQIKAIKKIFTPIIGAKHISESFSKSVVAAIVNSKLTDLKAPILEDSSHIEFCDLKNFNVEKSYKTYWKTMQFLVCHILELSLPKTTVIMHLSSPWPMKSLGLSTFASDIYIDTKNDLFDRNIPKIIEVLNKQIVEYLFKSFESELIFTSKKNCKEIFKFNKQKLSQIDSILTDDDKLPIYRFGSHVDLSFGPLLPKSNFIGRTQFTAITKIQAYGPDSKVYRVQGISIPSEDNLDDKAFDLLYQNAKMPNGSPHILLDGTEVYMDGSPYVWKKRKSLLRRNKI